MALVLPAWSPRARIAIAIAILALAHGALLLVKLSGAGAAGDDPAVTAGIVFDVSGRGDKSFNDGAYNGGVRADRELDAEVRLIEPGDGADREAGLRLLAAEGMQLVVGVGFIFTDDLRQLAGEYGTTSFAGVDYALPTDSLGNVIPPPSNRAALKFREEVGSFLVGALAALVSSSRRLGFVGGMDIPLIHKFEAGLMGRSTPLAALGRPYEG